MTGSWRLKRLPRWGLPACLHGRAGGPYSGGFRGRRQGRVGSLRRGLVPPQRTTGETMYLLVMKPIRIGSFGCRSGPLVIHNNCSDLRPTGGYSSVGKVRTWINVWKHLKQKSWRKSSSLLLYPPLPSHRLIFMGPRRPLRGSSSHHYLGLLSTRGTPPACQCRVLQGDTPVPGR
jgi:hypothetical protein